MIDGSFSRPRWLQLVTQKLEPDNARVCAALAPGNVSTIDAILVAHSHPDHSLDSAPVAQVTGAKILGSKSTRKIAEAQGFEGGHVELVKAGGIRRFGDDFEIIFFESPHAPGPTPSGEIKGARQVRGTKDLFLAFVRAGCVSSLGDCAGLPSSLAEERDARAEISSAIPVGSARTRRLFRLAVLTICSENRSVDFHSARD